MKKIIRIFAVVLGMAAFFVLASDCEDLQVFVLSKLVAVVALVSAYLLCRSTFTNEEWEKFTR